MILVDPKSMKIRTSTRSETGFLAGTGTSTRSEPEIPARTSPDSPGGDVWDPRVSKGARKKKFLFWGTIQKDEWWDKTLIKEDERRLQTEKQTYEREVETLEAFAEAGIQVRLSIILFSIYSYFYFGVTRLRKSIRIIFILRRLFNSSYFIWILFSWRFILCWRMS